MRFTTRDFLLVAALLASVLGVSFASNNFRWTSQFTFVTAPAETQPLRPWFENAGWSDVTVVRDGRSIQVIGYRSLMDDLKHVPDWTVVGYGPPIASKSTGQLATWVFPFFVIIYLSFTIPVYLHRKDPFKANVRRYSGDRS